MSPTTSRLTFTLGILGALAVVAPGCALDDEGGAVPFPPGHGGAGGTMIPEAGADQSVGGSGGTAGAGGTGGDAGAAGSAGVSGSAGTGGVAGSAGNAGTGGVAGSAGNAGTGGVAGSAGNAGAGGVAGSAGNAGTGGVAGSSGNGGTGGIAGSAGSAGTGGGAGAAGSAGTAGSSGAAGTGGVAGSAGSAGAAGTAGSSGSGGTGGVAGAAGTAGTGGTGTGGTGGTGTGGTGGTGTGGTGGTGIPESDCVDGSDNDGDGLVDCADPDCTPDYECVDAPPTGWEGFFWYRTSLWSASPSNAETCPDLTQPTRYFEEPSGPLDCQCSCGDVQGATCRPAPIGCTAGNANCSGLSDWTGDLADGQCHKPANGNHLSCRLTGPAPVNAPGGCEPGVNINNTDTFGQIQDVCGAPLVGGGGCGANRVCVPKATVPYDSTACIRKFGVEVCPSGWNDEHQVYSDADDLRSCSACSCAPDAGSVTCSGTVYTAYDNNQCGSGASTVTSNQCTDLSGLADAFTWSMRLTSTPTASGGTCTASGGDAQGAIITTGPATFCCAVP